MLRISVEGINLERFVNKLNAAGITLYSVVRERYDLMTCNIDYADFAKITSANSELCCRIKVIKQYGLRFLFGRMMRRKAFFVGAAIFIVFLTVMSSSIWQIDIEGIERIEPTDVIEVINSEGMGIGVFKTRCDTKRLELAIRKALPDVDWVIVEFQGVLMKVRIIETVEGVERTDKTPSSIVSEVNGEIVSIDVLKGDAAVKVGDEVKAGDILINGVFDRLSEKEFSMVRNALGKITARVTYYGTAEQRLDSIDSRVYSGNEKYSFFIEIFGKKLFERDNPYENATITDNSRSFFWGKLVITSRKYREFTRMTEEEQKEEAIKRLIRDAFNDAERLIPLNAEIENQNTEYRYDEEERVFYATASVTAIHEIGVREELSDEDIIKFGESKKNE